MTFTRIRFTTCLAVFVLSLLCAFNAHAQIDPQSMVGAWLFDEGSGNLAKDNSGHGYDAELMENPTWTQGIRGQALEFQNGSYLEIRNSSDTLGFGGSATFTITAWVKNQGGGTVLGKYNAGVIGAHFLQLDAAGIVGFDRESPPWILYGTHPLPTNEFGHVAATYDGTTLRIYVNGELDVEQDWGAQSNDTVTPVLIGARHTSSTPSDFFNGVIDEVAIFNVALTEAQIREVMNGLPSESKASAPVPEDEATDVLRDTSLSWTATDTAATHNVYFGSSWEDVNAANLNAPLGVLVSEGQTETTCVLEEVLTFGESYFWRIDEVNGAPDYTVVKGNVWSFTVEPYSIQIPGSTIAATASSSTQTSLPGSTVDGSGLTGSTHSVNTAQMWLSASPDLSPWLMFEFNDMQKLDRMLLWNANSLSEAFVGWGLKDVTIEYSMDGVYWTALAEATQINQAPGLAAYDAPQVIDFGRVQAKYVRLNILSNWGGLLKQYGVSEVQFYGLPVRARTPEPASGSVDVPPNAVLTWRAGREADQHTVYVSFDPNALADGSAASAPSMTNSMDLSSFDLQLGTSYYWRVDEVNEAEVPVVWTGPVWRFDTGATLTVEDFETYGNLSPNRPFQTWTDGFGYSADEFFPVTYPGNGTGAGIGHDIWSPGSPNFDGTIMETERTIPGSSQSMPFYYANTGGVASQTERTFAAAQDWTVGGVKTLSIAFRGQAGNTGTLYVKINNTKVTYPHDPGHIALSVWQAWNIDLASVNTNLEAVTALAIGVDGSGASGMVLIDDMTLHASPGELITPVQPADTNLVLRYQFDEGAGASIADASGHGHTGTFEVLPLWATGVSGGAASFNGVSNYVSVPASVWSSVNTQFTVSFWAKGHADLANNWGFYAGDAAGRIVSCHLPWDGDVIFDTTPGWANERVLVGAAPDELIGQWRLWTFVRNTDTGEKQVYMDGILYGSAAPSAAPIAGIDRFFIGAGDAGDSPYRGLIDDFQIHNRALSAEEILWMAGVKTPIDKPF